MDGEVAFMSAIIDERNQNVQTIYKEMREVKEIMQDLSSLVKEQGDLIG